MDPVLDYEKLAEKLLAKASVSAKAVGSTPTATYGHGMGGLFSSPGLERPVFSALILPAVGLASLLPSVPSDETNPLYGIMTGVTPSSGSEPNGVCDDPPTVGLMKLCTHSFLFGRFSRMTKIYDITRMGKRINRSDMTDLRLMNIASTDGNPMVPTGPLTPQQAVNVEIQKSLFEFAVAWSRDFATKLYDGNPANNTAGGGHKEFYGLDILINTGYRDAETGVACPAADSIVMSFGNAEVSSNGGTLVRTVTNIYRRLKHIAKKAGMWPATWTIAMTDPLFYEVTEIWPCAYHTYRCQSGFSATQVNSIDSAQLVRMRDEMREGKYLLIDGEKVSVTLDDGIDETMVAGESFRSTMYFVPLRVLGSTPVTYWEYFDFDGPSGPMEAAKVLAPDGSYYTSDGGRFIWHRKPPTNWCNQALALTEPRVMLLTPMIAARLTNIQYTPLAHERQWEPGASYYKDGGKTERDIFGPSYYSPTA